MITIILAAILGRQAGGGLGADWLTQRVRAKFGSFTGSLVSRAPELVFTALLIYLGGISWLWFVPLYFVIETGHGNAYHDGVEKDRFDDRFQTLDYIVRPLCRFLQPRFPSLDFSPRGTHYCRLFMFAKGVLIGLPFGFIAPLAGIVWAGSYTFGWRVLHPRFTATVFAEYASYAGLAALMGV